MHFQSFTRLRTALSGGAVLLALLSTSALSAQTTIAMPDRNQKTHIAPAYFGPNAFPVPEMSDDAVSGNLQLSLRGDYFMGDYGDHTGSLMATLRIPPVLLQGQPGGMDARGGTLQPFRVMDTACSHYPRHTTARMDHRHGLPQHGHTAMARGEIPSSHNGQGMPQNSC